MYTAELYYIQPLSNGIFLAREYFRDQPLLSVKTLRILPVKSQKILANSINFKIYIYSGFIWDFGKLPFPSHLGKYIIKNGKISTKIQEIGKIKAIFGLGMTPI